ncbi:MAG: polymer-forming cytoskeletal protein [Anaerolineales bacterium]|nr:polymer-forming cytoskeletal protein [Anaerolineales bacterium]
MKIKSNLVRIILLLALLLLPTSTVFAQSPGGDVVLFGQNYTLESGDELNGSLAVFGGNVSIEKDSTINGDVALIGGNLSLLGDTNGDVALIGGNLTISGTIEGDIVIIGGQALLSETAVVNGDISTIGGNVEKKPGAEVNGNITNNAPPVIDVPDVPNVPNVPNVPGVPETPNVDVNINPFWSVGSKVGQAILVALVGMLLTLFLQPQLERAGNAMVRQPFIAGGYGFLVFIAVPVAIFILAITIILIPIALIVALIAPLAWLFGMVALGQEVGDRFTKAINQIWAPVLSTGFGTFLLVLVTGLISLIPCVGWLPSFLVTLVALGGVAMTWFGTRNAPGGTVSQQVVEVPPTS